MPDDVEQFADWNLASHLPEGSMPLGFTAVMKYLDPAGDVRLATATSADIPDWELVGMHRTAILQTELDIKSALIRLDGDDD